MQEETCWLTQVVVEFGGVSVLPVRLLLLVVICMCVGVWFLEITTIIIIIIRTLEQHEWISLSLQL